MSGAGESPRVLSHEWGAVEIQGVGQLRERGIDVVQDETSESIDVYNRLAAEGHRVAALVHSTC